MNLVFYQKKSTRTCPTTCLLVSYFLLIACLLTYCLFVCLCVCWGFPLEAYTSFFRFYHLIIYANSNDYVAIKRLCVEIDRDKLKPNPISISYRLPQVYVQRCLFKLTLSKSPPPSPSRRQNLCKIWKHLPKWWLGLNFTCRWFRFCASCNKRGKCANNDEEI